MNFRKFFKNISQKTNNRDSHSCLRRLVNDKQTRSVLVDRIVLELIAFFMAVDGSNSCAFVGKSLKKKRNFEISQDRIYFIFVETMRPRRFFIDPSSVLTTSPCWYTRQPIVECVEWTAALFNAHCRAHLSRCCSFVGACWRWSTEAAALGELLVRSAISLALWGLGVYDNWSRSGWEWKMTRNDIYYASCKSP